MPEAKVKLMNLTVQATIEFFQSLDIEIDDAMHAFITQKVEDFAVGFDVEGDPPLNIFNNVVAYAMKEYITAF